MNWKALIETITTITLTTVVLVVLVNLSFLDGFILYLLIASALWAWTFIRWDKHMTKVDRRLEEVGEERRREEYEQWARPKVIVFCLIWPIVMVIDVAISITKILPYGNSD